MTTVFAIKNQHGLYLTKQQEWANGADNQSLFRTAYKDEAINTVFELSSRDIYVRAEAVSCELDAKGNPIVENPIAEIPGIETADAATADIEAPEVL